MKKICFISCTNLYLVPYLKNYLSLVRGQSDILVWNRHNIKEKVQRCNVIEYRKEIEDNNASKKEKLRGYAGFSKFLRSYLRTHRYDIVICLQTVGALLCTDVLLRFYKRKYIIDIRDFSIEGNKALSYVEKILLQNSRLNVISSEGYRNFLPPKLEYQLVHNYSQIDKENLQQFRKNKIDHTSLNLSYIGLIRFQEQNKKIIDLFANDRRFHINFIGKNALELKEYIKAKGIDNVTLIDQFPAEKTLDYYKDTDAILNVYGHGTPLLDYALSNKLYYAAALNIPILVSKGTFMENISVQYKFGFVLDFEDKEIKDKLYSYVINIDREKFFDDCQIFMRKVKKTNQEFAFHVEEILN